MIGSGVHSYSNMGHGTEGQVPRPTKNTVALAIMPSTAGEIR